MVSVIKTLTKKMEITELIKNYLEFIDKYFIRAKEILIATRINPLVRYQVFARKNIEKLKGVDEAVEFIEGVVGNEARVYALRDNQKYKAKEPIMKIEGGVQDIIDLETAYLQILSGNFTGPIDLEEVRKNAREIKKAAEDKSVLYFGARHFHYNLDEKIAKICQEEGFSGTSTDIGARAWNAKGLGTIPHALILSYAAYMDENNIKGNPSVEAAKGFDKYIDKAVSRINLIDTFNREITDSIETAKAVPSLRAVRIDTCGENYAQGSREVKLPRIDVDKKYLWDKGVSIAAVWALRRGLDKADFRDLEIVVSSGFNAEKTVAFMEADRIYQKMYGKPLFNSIGTGSIFNSAIMTTSDIVTYFNEKKRLWIPMSKVGRDERKTNRLERR